MRRLIVLTIFMFTMLAPTAQSIEPVVVAVQDVVLQVGDTISVPIQVECPTMTCATFDTMLSYDPSMIEIISFNWGDFPTSQDSEILPIDILHDAIVGTFRASYITTNDSSSFSSSGILMTLDIRAFSPGVTSILPTDIIVGEVDGSVVQSIVTQAGELIIQELAVPPTPTRIPCQSDPGDVDDNGIIDGHDLGQVSSAYMEPTSNDELSDLNNDGEINVLDVILVSRHLGQIDGCAS